MRNLNRKRVSRLPDIIIAAGVLLLLAPVFLSLRMSVLQARERVEEQPSPPPVSAPKAAPVEAPKQPAAPPQKPPVVEQPQKPSIVIPKLGLDAVIVEEVTEADLDRGPMRLAGTGFPGQGNCCIAAHKEKWFRNLKKLVAGDKVILKSEGKDYVYTVTSHRIVSADDLSVLENTPDPTITLITCTNPRYLRRGEGRLIVIGKLKT